MHCEVQYTKNIKSLGHGHALKAYALLCDVIFVNSYLQLEQTINYFMTFHKPRNKMR